MGDGFGTRGEGVLPGVGGEETGVAWGSRGAGIADDVGGEEDGEDIGGEGGDQNREKSGPMEELEVHRANPILEDGHPFPDQHGTCAPDFREVECSVHFVEEFEGEDVAAEDDRTVGRDLSMGVDGAHIFHNIVLHIAPRERKPPHNSRMWQHCNNHMPNV